MICQFLIFNFLNLFELHQPDNPFFGVPVKNSFIYCVCFWHSTASIAGHVTFIVENVEAYCLVLLWNNGRSIGTLGLRLLLSSLEKFLIFFDQVSIGLRVHNDLKIVFSFFSHSRRHLLHWSSQNWYGWDVWNDCQVLKLTITFQLFSLLGEHHAMSRLPPFFYLSINQSFRVSLRIRFSF